MQSRQPPERDAYRKHRAMTNEARAVNLAQIIRARLEQQIGNMATIKQEVENSDDAGHYVAIRISPSNHANLKLIADAVNAESKASQVAGQSGIPVVISFI